MAVLVLQRGLLLRPGHHNLLLFHDEDVAAHGAAAAGRSKVELDAGADQRVQKSTQIAAGSILKSVIRLADGLCIGTKKDGNGGF